ncbi:MAG: hypothetical protein J7494_11775 [Sphingobium sp.]|nr:hypothetical protein [Sphingobium sp.]
MIKTLIVGAALGFFSKKLYDEGKFDPYLSRMKETIDGIAQRRSSDAPPAGTGSADQPDMAF